MASSVPPASVSLDPLVAEAKRRARIRRSFLAAAALALGAVGATFALRSSERPQPAIIVARSCVSSQLHLVPGGGGVAGGTADENFSLINSSGVSCALRGWPAVQLVQSNGRVLTPPVRRDHLDARSPTGVAPVQRVELHPGSAATFGILDADSPDHTTCSRVTTLLVTPAPHSKPLSVPFGLGQYCGPHLIEVPLVAGRTNHED